MFANAIVFPTTGWESDLSCLPPLNEERLVEFYRSKSTTERCYDRSYNFTVESYLIASTVACNHLLSMLRMVALLQSKGFSEAPEDITCTDLPQQWRVPRGKVIKGSSVQGIDWRSVREGGLSVPKLARPTERRVNPRTKEEQAAAQKKLCRSILARDANNPFARGLSLTPGQPYKETKYGLAPASSPLAYQQALLPHGFSAQLSGITPVSLASTQLVPTLDLFKDVEPWMPAVHQTTSGILEKVRTTRESSLTLERDTRQQSRSATWQKERAPRLTASNFGVVLARQQWSSKGLQAITASRDLSRVAPIRYGISNEPIAAKRYEEVLQNMGHDVTVAHCGLLVNPAFPWLGASPDRLVYDPAEGSYGVLEIKCPYSLREKKGEELATATFCSELTDSGPRLKREDYYYAQLVGQMGVSGLSWGTL
ncbi:hypothetical protein HPB52_006218 [Rhipicephalus sanguineus]|uniref:YqaJ viral recombinase domain-containing protein n=1 Tax=Rhipicephalus sanguineus TaxID=34632 RepID=A0A9D4T7R2_RHISA|nr:hypothetical protein HPB52_006218 [Rhipicephalus sanguineus]